jgi:nucleotide-binding universal stress UspA family protein
MNQQAPPVFARIVVPLDGSALAEQALPYARAIGGESAELILVTVLPPADRHQDLVGRTVAPNAGDQSDAETATREGLRRAARTWLGERPGIQLEITAGDPATEILRVADQRGAGLIVLAGHGRGAVGRAVFGSVADRVAHASPVPVMIVRPRDATAELAQVIIRRLVVPHDGSELGARAVPIAEALARQLNVPVMLVRAVDLAEVLRPIADELLIPSSVVEDAQTAARQSLEEAATPLRDTGVVAEGEVWIGPAFNVIVEAVQTGDVIVLCSHGRSGVTRWLLGSVAEKLVREGPVPVIVVPVGSRVPTG